MALPMVDKESHQFSASEWITYAGQALQQAGYLQTEPTGLYDEEFAAAVQAFQAFHGIHEEDHVGPYTWAALGIEDTEQADTGHALEVGALSEDGQWHWDGSQWQAAEQHAVEGLAIGEVAHAFTPTADSSEFEDTELANSIFQSELAILREWKAALDSFHVVIKSETQAAAKPDFAGALLKVFGEKVLGKAISEFKAGIVFDALKAIVSEAERAKAAAKSVAFRDFYTTHQTHIANMDKELVTHQPVFVAAVRKEAERLLRNDPDGYGMLRMEIMDLYQDAERRLQTATQESLFADLSAEWVSGNVSAGGEIRIRLHEDLSVIDVKITAPDGDKLVEQLTQQPGGMDVWHMHAPKLLIYMDAGGNNSGWVRLDAGNHLANLPAEQDGKYKKRYEQLIAHGGLAPVTKH
jgi:Putative peptidoglycan binding domain